MKVSHTRSAVSSAFDDPNLVSAAGLVPVVGLAAATGLGDLVDDCRRPSTWTEPSVRPESVRPEIVGWGPSGVGKGAGDSSVSCLHPMTRSRGDQLCRGFPASPFQRTSAALNLLLHQIVCCTAAT
jgi:hypothetical protein